MTTSDGISGITLRIECEWGGFTVLEQWHLNSLRGDPRALLAYIFEHSLVTAVHWDDRTESPANPEGIRVDRGENPAGGGPPSPPPAGTSQ